MKTECTSQETTILLHGRQTLNKGSEEEGCGALPSTNSTLFLALRAVNIERLQEW